MRSVNGLKDDLVLEAVGSLSLESVADTLRIRGADSFDTLSRRRLDTALQHAKTPHMTLDSIGLMSFKTHVGDGWSHPGCSASTEGMLHYQGHYGMDGSGALVLCRYDGTRYVWAPVN